MFTLIVWVSKNWQATTTLLLLQSAKLACNYNLFLLLDTHTGLHTQREITHKNCCSYDLYYWNSIFISTEARSHKLKLKHSCVSHMRIISMQHNPIRKQWNALLCKLIVPIKTRKFGICFLLLAIETLARRVAIRKNNWKKFNSFLNYFVVAWNDRLVGMSAALVCYYSSCFTLVDDQGSKLSCSLMYNYIVYVHHCRAEQQTVEKLKKKKRNQRK